MRTRASRSEASVARASSIARFARAHEPLIARVARLDRIAALRRHAMHQPRLDERAAQPQLIS